MHNKKKSFAYGFLIAVMLFLIAANPSFNQFNTSQFNTTGNIVSVGSGALFTNSALSNPTWTDSSGNVQVQNGPSGRIIFTGSPNNLIQYPFLANGTGLLPLSITSGGFLTNLPATTNLLQPVINVADYGALGNNVNDSVAISNAVRKWTNFGGILFFPPGTYVDTNIYGWSMMNVKQGAGNLGYQQSALLVMGSGSGQTIWSAKVTNGVFMSFTNGLPDFRDITIQNTGIGTNTGIYEYGNGNAPNFLNTFFANWTSIALQPDGLAGGTFYGGGFNACGIGLGLHGFCDGWLVNCRIDACTNIGIEVGGTSPEYPQNNAHGNYLHVTGARNNIAVVVGNGSGCTISGYIENATNGCINIGHPTSFGYGNESPQTITVQDFGYLSSTVANKDGYIVVLNTNCTLLVMRGIQQDGTCTNVLSLNGNNDFQPVIFEGTTSSQLFTYSTGTVISAAQGGGCLYGIKAFNNSSSLTYEVASGTGGSGITVNQQFNMLKAMFVATNGAGSGTMISAGISGSTNGLSVWSNGFKLFNVDTNGNAFFQTGHATNGIGITGGGIVINGRMTNSYASTGSSDANMFMTDATSASFVPLFYGTAPNLTSGQTTFMEFGQSINIGDSVFFGFVYTSDASANNRFDIGFKGKTDMSLLYGGNVGIGTIAPSTLLQVAGVATINGGVSSLSTDVTMTTSETGFTNTTTVVQVAYVTAATGASLNDNAGTTEFSGVTISSFTPIRIQVGGKFVATAVTYATGTSAHGW